MAHPNRKTWQETLLEAQLDLEGESGGNVTAGHSLTTMVAEMATSVTATPSAPSIEILPDPADDEVVTPPSSRASMIKRAMSAFGHWLVIGAILIGIVVIAFFLAAYQRIAAVTLYQ